MMKMYSFIGLVILAIFAISSVEPCQPKGTMEPGAVDCGMAKNFGSCQDPCRWSHVVEKCITKEEFDKFGWNGLVNAIKQLGSNDTNKPNGENESYRNADGVTNTNEANVPISSNPPISTPAPLADSKSVTEQPASNVPTAMNNTNGASNPTGTSVPIEVTEETAANVPTETSNADGASNPTETSVVTEETGTKEPTQPSVPVE